MGDKSAKYRVGADVGGTFTDIIVMADDGTTYVKKLLSTPGNYAEAVVTGLREVFQETSLDGGAVEDVRHGTTVATNAILELKGAKTGLITTKGFRDILEIRQQRPRRDPEAALIDAKIPPPLVPRAFRMEVDERINYKGEVLRPLDTGEVRSTVQHLVNNGIESIAVCLLNSYVNPIHEQMIGELIRKEFPRLYLSLSSEILPQIREYERTSTMVINSYIGPIVRGYLSMLELGLKNIGVTAPLLIMQSSGGVMASHEASAKPMCILESGPAAGVVAARQLSEKCAFSKVISLDMGGTTAKASMIENGNIAKKYEYNVGGGITVGTRWLGGAGYPLSAPSVDIAEVGAGGGSIIWLDKGGLVQVGPQSSGAMPGPACYDMGGTEPTVTDANVVLGYLNPHYLAGGRLKLAADKAFASLQPIAKALGLPTHEVAYGAHLIANANMARAVKAVSSEQGKDPRDCVLFAYGGGGPVHGAELARFLGIERMLVPLWPGLFSSLGLAFARVEHDFVRSLIAVTRDISPADIDQIANKLQEEALATLKGEGYQPEEVILKRFADLRYLGQYSEVTVPIESGTISRHTISLLKQAFVREYERMYEIKDVGEPVEMVNIRLVATGQRGQFMPFASLGDARQKRPSRDMGRRKAYFGHQFGFLDTPVLARVDLSSQLREGPMIIEEYDSTLVVPPRCKARLDESSNIILEI